MAAGRSWQSRSEISACLWLLIPLKGSDRVVLEELAQGGAVSEQAKVSSTNGGATSAVLCAVKV